MEEKGGEEELSSHQSGLEVHKQLPVTPDLEPGL